MLSTTSNNGSKLNLSAFRFTYVAIVLNSIALHVCEHVCVCVCVCVCVYVCWRAGFQQSLVVDYNLLASKQPPIAVLLPDAPIEMFRIFDEVKSTIARVRSLQGM